jgi:hypothetical protein
VDETGNRNRSEESHFDNLPEKEPSVGTTHHESEPVPVKQNQYLD